MTRGEDMPNNGQGNGQGQQRNRSQLSSTPQGRRRAEAAEARMLSSHSAPGPTAQQPVYGIDRVLLDGKRTDGRVNRGFPDPRMT